MATTAASEWFDREKKRTIHDKTDLSRKGSVDVPILDVVDYINGHNHYYTTSSCSGRIIVFSESTDHIKKKGCKWILTSHEPITIQQLQSSLSKENLIGSEGYVYLKFEAMVLHIACRDMLHAQHMLHSSVSSGFRNSGMSVSNKGRIIVAVRSTHSLQAPIAIDECVLVTDEYLEHIVEIANHKMSENMTRITRFFEAVQVKQQKLESRTIVDRKVKHCIIKDHDDNNHQSYTSANKDNSHQPCTTANKVVIVDNDDDDNSLELCIKDLFDC